MDATHVIKSGCGYWDCTNYGLGGCFKRAAQDIPVELHRAPAIVKTYGQVAFFRDSDGRLLGCQDGTYRPIS